MSIPVDSDGSGIVYIDCTGATFSGSTTVSGNTVTLITANQIRLTTPVTGGGALSLANVTLPAVDGSKSVSFTVTDGAGNISTSVGALITLDTTAPSVPVVPSTPPSTFFSSGIYYTTLSSVNFSLYSSDTGSGVYGYQVDGGTWTAGNVVMLTPGSHSILVRDNVGNQNATPLMVTLTQDITGPTYVNATWSAGNIITVNFTDACGLVTAGAFICATGYVSPLTLTGAQGLVYSTNVAVTQFATYFTLSGWTYPTASYYCYFQITMSDNLGNVSPVQYIYYIDTPAVGVP